MSTGSLLRWVFGDRSAMNPESSAVQDGFDPSQSVTIGSQTWMSRNLDVSRFQNGDPIPEARRIEDWVNAGKNGRPAWCYYENKPELGAIYGRLYNWYAVVDVRRLAPDGWHIPSDPEHTQNPATKEFTQLVKQLGGTHYAGSKLKEA